MTPGRWILSVLSVLILAVGAGMIVRKRSRRFMGFAWLTVGVALALVAFKPDLFGGQGPASLVMRMRLVLGALSGLVLLITLEAVRRFAMQERYALLWVSTGAILVVFAIYPDAVGWLAVLTGMQYATAITVVVFAFLLMIAFHFSLALSQFREDQKRTAQRTGILELRIAELEKALAARGGNASDNGPAKGTRAAAGPPPSSQST